MASSIARLARTPCAAPPGTVPLHGAHGTARGPRAAAAAAAAPPAADATKVRGSKAAAVVAGREEPCVVVAVVVLLAGLAVELVVDELPAL